MEKSCQCARKKKRSEAEEKSLLNRLHRIEGQVRGLEKMIGEDAYCVDILLQVSAVREALNSFSRLLLEEHINSCVVQDLQAGKKEAAEELVMLLRKMR
ncbi:MAG: metal-sensing transcriptional repressor [Clostridia bacterium]|nr:metal-sensing transcriptional repressor [Clostridia bacterium]